MQKSLVLYFILLASPALAQTATPLAMAVAAQHVHGAPAVLDPFTELQNTTRFDHVVKEATVATIDPALLPHLQRDAPVFIRLRLPFKGDTLLVDLVREDNHMTTPNVRTPEQEHVSYTPGLHYRGILVGTATSLAAFSFFADQLMGVVSSMTLGNVQIGRLLDPEGAYVIYSDRDLLVEREFQCGSDALPSTHQLPQPIAAERSEKCVRMYYEVTHEIFVTQGSVLSQTIDWMTGLHNVVATVMANDGITIAISEIFVWTTPVQFTLTGDYLFDIGYFKTYRTTFNGDMANCVSMLGSGGASGGRLCTDPYTMSCISLDYAQLPAYSSTVMVLAHEMGHSMGSPHTHECVWNGNNTQIDDCAYEGQTFPGGCYDPENPIIPPYGEGTIMSYCVNALVAGFGPQPGQLIRDFIASAPCLGTDCITSCSPTMSNVRMEQIGGHSALLLFDETDPSITDWEIRLTGMNHVLVSDWQTITTTSHLFTDLTPDSWYTAHIKQRCHPPYSTSFDASIEFKTVVTFCGSEITDLSGPMPYLYDCMEAPRTLRPDLPGRVVTLDFTVFATEQDSDFFEIYNGPDIDSPLLMRVSGTQPPFSVTSTAPGGELTYRLTCPMLEWEELAGWVFTVSCAPPLSVGLLEGTAEALKIHPVPTTGMLTVSISEPLKGRIALMITDVQGRLVKSLDPEALQRGEGSMSCDLSALASGTYLLHLHSATLTRVVRFVRSE